eukprot:768658-Hanusia_phi.AAC.10
MEEQDLSDGEEEEDRSVSIVKGDNMSRAADGRSLRSMRSTEAQPAFLLEKTLQDWNLSNFSSEELMKARNTLTREVETVLLEQHDHAEVRDKARSVRSARSTNQAYHKALNDLSLNMYVCPPPRPLREKSLCLVLCLPVCLPACLFPICLYTPLPSPAQFQSLHI